MSQDENNAGGSRRWVNLSRYLENPWLRCVALVFLGLSVHLPSLSGELFWDDNLLVENNPFVKSPLLILEAFRHYLFPDTYSGHYRPVQTISYIFDYFFWNRNPFGYHLSNVLWHVLSGVLLYHLLTRVLRTLVQRCAGFWFWENEKAPSAVAFLMALLWTVHPVHSAAVDYVSGRADSLAFSFACAGWLLYLQAREVSGKWGRRSMFALAAAGALLSLCSRETGALWMILFLLYVFVFERGPRLRTKLAVFAVCLMVLGSYLGMRQLPEHHSDDASSSGWTPATRGMLMLRALGDYGRLLIFPSQLHVERTILEPNTATGHADLRSRIAAQGLTLSGGLMLAIFLLGMSRKGVGQRTRVFGAIWFLLAYLPTSNLVDLNATVAEHWLYLPSVGFLIFLAGVLFDLPSRFLRPVSALACLALVGLSVRAAIRSSDWADPETFYRRTFAAGGSSSRIGVNLAVIYATRGEDAKAEAILRKVLQVHPNYSLARHNLAIALFRQGKTAEAEATFETATQSPAQTDGYARTCDAAKNLARLRHKEGDDTAALRILDQAAREYPGNWELIRVRAEIIRNMEGPAAALPVVKDFVREHWWHARASISLAGLFVETGDLPGAMAALRHASRLDVYDTDALNFLAMINVGQNKLDEARQIQQRALARQPDQPRQYLILSDILQRMGRPGEAREAAGQANLLESIAKSHSLKVAGPIAN